MTDNRVPLKYKNIEKHIAIVVYKVATIYTNILINYLE